MSNVPSSNDQEAINLVRELNSIELPKFRVIGGIIRYEKSARNSMKDVKQRIVASLTSRPYGCDNYLLWAPPGSGKSFFVQEIARSLGDAIHYREINLAQMDESQFRQALAEIVTLDRPRLCLIDEVDSKPGESWPYEVLLPSLEPPAGKRVIRTCYVLAGSSGGSTSGMKEGIARRTKGIDLLSRIPPGNEFVIEGLGLGDRLLVVSAQFLNAAKEYDRQINEVEKLVLYYVALNPKLKSARQIRQLAIRCIERMPSGEDRIRYDHLFDPGDPENKDFWNSASALRNELANSFVRLEDDQVVLKVSTAKLQPSRIDEKHTTEGVDYEKNRIAVLPFSNISPDPRDEYFADGMTEELISTISKISGLQVIARTSVLRYKNASKGIDEIGKELNVGAILEGSVRKAGEKLRITAQLIDSTTSQHLWSESYDRELKDVFAIQSDISRTVAEALKVRLLPSEREEIRKESTENTEAYELCLKGMYYDSNKKITADLKKAIQCFESAIHLDPTFALAYSLLSGCYSSSVQYNLLPTTEALPKAEETVRKALDLDPRLAEAHIALGSMLMLRFDWRPAEDEYRKAIDLNPNLSAAHEGYSILLRQMRRLDEALVEARKSLQLNPLSRSANYALHWVLHDRGQFGRDMEEYDRAIDHLKRMREFDPDFMDATVLIGWIYLHKSQLDPSPRFYEQAIEEFRKIPNLSPDTGSWWTFGCFAGLVWAYTRSGRKEEAKKIQAQIQEFSKTHYVSPDWLANIHLGLGENDEAMQLLERAYDERDYGSLSGINVEPMYDALRSDPRFIALLKKIGLDEFGNLAIPSG